MKAVRFRLLMAAFILMASFGVLAQQTRTVTNADLEKFRAARVAAEDDYRRNYEKRGMPSPEELERRNAEDIAATRVLSQNLEAQQRAASAGFQAQANALRAQIAGIDAQIAYLSSLGNAGAVPTVNYGLGYVPYIWNHPYNGYRPTYRRGGYGSVAGAGQNTQAVRDQAAQSPSAASIRAQANANTPATALPRTYQRAGSRRSYYAPVVIGVTGNSTGQNEIEARLSYLYQVRAGLVAQLDSVVEQARMSGAGL